MTRFRRSAHWRRNPSGSLTWVSDHSVVRSDWDREPSASRESIPLQATPLSLGDLHLNGITRPSSCPVCGDPVFFFLADNGGRVFFDELGPPWPKHPCTVHDNQEILFVQGHDGGAAEYEIPEGLPFEVYPRIGRTVISVKEDEERHLLLGDLPLDRTYHPELWIMKDRGGRIRSLSILDANLEPLTVRVRKGSPIKPLDAATRRQLTLEQETEALLKRVTRAVEGLANATLVRHKATGAFIFAYAGKSRVFILPVPVDHCEDTRRDASSVIKYMLDTAQTVQKLARAQSSLAKKALFDDVFVFPICDALSVASDGLGQHFFCAGEPWDGGVSWELTQKITSLAAGSFLWVNASAPIELELTEHPTTVEQARSREIYYCAEVWPSEGGQWGKICTSFDKLGLGELFRTLHAAFVAAGFKLDFAGAESEYDVTYSQVAEGGKGRGNQSVKVLLHLSSAAEGLALLLNYPFYADQLKDHITWFKDQKSFPKLLARLRAL